MKRAGTEATSGGEASAVAEEGFLQRFSRRKHEARLAESEVPPYPCAAKRRVATSRICVLTSIECSVPGRLGAPEGLPTDR